ncbi:unnamed protein product [Pleuronectes platessa]|uniref:Uncharacterized protein n=1 Tax=Pleuronectes platessa TaxID=8262 RepID=A0A9N7VQT7_PLEPL|nr:unnamed protein product [Pleuronectes platessa]
MERDLAREKGTLSVSRRIKERGRRGKGQAGGESEKGVKEEGEEEEEEKKKKKGRTRRNQTLAGVGERLSQKEQTPVRILKEQRKGEENPQSLGGWGKSDVSKEYHARFGLGLEPGNWRRGERRDDVSSRLPVRMGHMVAALSMPVSKYTFFTQQE